MPSASATKLRFHIVTGKGGTGKTTVAAALAMALAAGGGRVLLTEVEGRQGIAQLFDTPPLPYEERKVASAPGGGDVVALAIDPEAALLEYLDMFYNLRAAGRVLTKLGAIDFATTIAPGVRDVLLTGKIKEAVDRKNKQGRPVFDAVVLDAPPTGRITRFLNVTADVASLARMGPIKNQSESVQRVVRSPTTAVHLVTLLEEMPVQETVDGVRELQAEGIPVGSVIVNMKRQPYALPKRLVKKDIAADLVAAGITGGRAVVDGLAAEAAAYRARIEIEAREQARLDQLGLPVVTLPLQPGHLDLGALYALAESLGEQGFPPARVRP
ncbi:MAG TPA: ArsA-related P-loop ATPase [Mycobacteriales bacterium]